MTQSVLHGELISWGVRGQGKRDAGGVVEPLALDCGTAVQNCRYAERASQLASGKDNKAAIATHKTASGIWHLLARSTIEQIRLKIHQPVVTAL